jgi:hypothetical protein
MDDYRRDNPYNNNESDEQGAYRASFPRMISASQTQRAGGNVVAELDYHHGIGQYSERGILQLADGSVHSSVWSSVPRLPLLPASNSPGSARRHGQTSRTFVPFY